MHQLVIQVRLYGEQQTGGSGALLLIAASGTLDGSTATRFAASLFEAIDVGRVRVVVDLSAADVEGPDGIRVLREAGARAGHAGVPFEVRTADGRPVLTAKRGARRPGQPRRALTIATSSPDDAMPKPVARTCPAESTVAASKAPKPPKGVRTSSELHVLPVREYAPKPAKGGCGDVADPTASTEPPATTMLAKPSSTPAFGTG